MTNPKAAILVIGDEILSGRTADKNINWLAIELTKRGIALKEARVIADDKDMIKKNAIELSAIYDYVFTSGGIGPTHDDITTDAIADAFWTPVVLNPIADARLMKYYHGNYTKVRQKMAYIPKGTTLIDNPINDAPGFIINSNVFVMAGVPEIFQAMFMTFADTLGGGIKPTSVTIQYSTPEGNLADIMADIDDEFPEISIGSYPFFDGDNEITSVVITGLSSKLANQTAFLLMERVNDAGFGEFLINN